MIARTLRLMGSVRAVDAASTRCNFRRFPIAVSCSRPPVVSFSAVVLVAIACLAAGLALGVLGYAFLNQHGVLP